jgi:hypothetical protein
LQPAHDYLVIHIDVVMDKYVAETNRSAHRGGQPGCEDAMHTEQPDGVTIVSRRTPAFRRTDVLRYINAGLDGSNERVFYAAQPDGILASFLAGTCLLLEDGGVVGNAPQQPQDAVFVYHS